MIMNKQKYLFRVFMCGDLSLRLLLVTILEWSMCNNEMSLNFLMSFIYFEFLHLHKNSKDGNR